MAGERIQNVRFPEHQLVMEMGSKRMPAVAAGGDDLAFFYRQSYVKRFGKLGKVQE